VDLEKRTPEACEEKLAVQQQARPGGVATSRRYREASFDGADGVVVQLQQIFSSLIHHPVSGHKVGIASFS
jgi:hypothetical protein